MLLLLLIVGFSACRRPEVVEKREAEIVDFEFRNKSSIKNPQITPPEEKTPLTPELFDPYYTMKKEYRITRGDVLEISIFGDDESSVRETVVAPDGRLYYMFLDGIPAEGRTLTEVAHDISSRIAHLFVNPEVTITPKTVMSQRYFMLGKIGRPGSYAIGPSITLRQAIGDAGGIAYGGYAGTTIQIASLRDSFIIRDGKKLDVDFAKLIFTEGSEYDIYLQPGDFIYVASSLVKQIYLIGAVNEQKPIPYKDGITLFQAISGPSGLSGGIKLGFAYGANPAQIMIIRGTLDNPRVMMVDFFKIIDGQARDVYLEPGDIVYVPNKKFRFARTVVRAAVNAFVSNFGSAAGSYYADHKWFPSGP
jgi:protein involved in polysaccharide export with SLBB domain